MKLVKWALILVAIIISLPFVFYLCYVLFGSDYGIELSNGYELSRIYAGAVMLCDPNKSVIVSQNIDGYHVYEDVIVGHVSKKGLPPGEGGAADSVPGYFIVDVHSNKVQQGLSEKAWLAKLRQYGITQRPSLHKPSRFDNSLFRGYTRP